MVPYSPTNVYVLARRFLCPVSCLTRATAQRLKKAVPSTTSVLPTHLYLTLVLAEAISTDVIIRFARSAGHSARRRTNGRIYSALTPQGGGSLTLAPIIPAYDL